MFIPLQTNPTSTVTLPPLYSLPTWFSGLAITMVSTESVRGQVHDEQSFTVVKPALKCRSQSCNYAQLPAMRTCVHNRYTLRLKLEGQAEDYDGAHGHSKASQVGRWKARALIRLVHTICALPMRKRVRVDAEMAHSEAEKCFKAYSKAFP